MQPRHPPPRDDWRGTPRVLLGSVVWLAVLVGSLLATPTTPAVAGASGVPEAVTTGHDHSPDDQLWAWPLEPRPAVRRAFDPPESRYGRGHRGIDLAASHGHPVLAVDAGTVTHSGMVAGRGTVTVRHAGGLESTYEPLEQRIARGTVVPVGAVIGAVGGPSHCAETTCLHLGARLGEDYLDPMLLLGPVRIVLLPLLQ